MINCSIVMRPNPLKKEEPKKAYACVQTSKKMNINQFAEHISSHGCVYSRADIAAILTMAVDCMRENLLDGVLIKLGDLGDFAPALKSIGAETAAENPSSRSTSYYRRLDGFGCILLCLLLLEPNSNDTRDLSHDGWRYGGTQ